MSVARLPGRGVVMILALTGLTTTSASAQVTAYGVTANGALFRFNPAVPGTVTTIGNMGIVPEAIDFRPGTGQLFAIDVGATTTQLYTVNTATAAVTPVGAGFPSTVAANPGAYTLSGPVGFDFNPRTLQADNSMRIRVTGTNGTNLRLNSTTGLVAAVDNELAIGTNAPFVDASAYINNAAATNAGATTLYDLDSRNDALYIQDPPNNGSLTLVGAMGVTVDALSGMAFDIVSTSTTDDSIADELAFAALRRGDGGGTGYLLYDVNLATGQILNGRAVGGGLDFTGGLAVTIVPEPATLAGIAAAGLLLRHRRR